VKINQVLSTYQKAFPMTTDLLLSFDYCNITPEMYCEYRRGLRNDKTGHSNYILALDSMNYIGRECGKYFQYVSSNSILDFICNTTRFNWIAKALKRTIDALSVFQSNELPQINLSYWIERYSRGLSLEYTFTSLKTQNIRIRNIGNDLLFLLDSVFRSKNAKLMDLKEVQELNLILKQQFITSSTGWQNPKDRLYIPAYRWRSEGCSFCL
jgi:hypothetical protein